MTWTIFPIFSKWPIFPNGRFFLVDHYTVDLFSISGLFFCGRYFRGPYFLNSAPCTWAPLYGGSVYLWRYRITSARPLHLSLCHLRVTCYVALTEEPRREAILLGIELSHFSLKYVVVVVVNAVAQAVGDQSAIRLARCLPDGGDHRRVHPALWTAAVHVEHSALTDHTDTDHTHRRHFCVYFLYLLFLNKILYRHALSVTR